MRLPGLKIRYAMPNDREFIVALGHRTASANASEARSRPQKELEESFDRLVNFVYASSHITFIAEVDGNPVGYLIMLDELPDDVTGAPQAFVVYAAVEEEFRNLGIAHILFTTAEDEARKRKLPHITLMVTEDNDQARRLYDKLGYFTERRLLCKTL